MQELAMKCDVCLEKLEEYVDGELSAAESAQVADHLITCADCSKQSSSLSAELEMYSIYDRDLEVPVSLWEKIAERTAVPVVIVSPRPGFFQRLVDLFRVPSFAFSVATAAVLVVIGLIVASAYISSRKGVDEKKFEAENKPGPAKEEVVDHSSQTPPRETVLDKEPQRVAVVARKRIRRPAVKHSPIDQTDVVSSDLGYMDLDDRETAAHLEQAQNLLRSIRNVEVGDSDQEIDVSYDKAMSRRLLNENIVLRREAEMKAKFPTKALLSDLEPFLIDIANLPDHAKPDDVRVIKERVRKTEIVAALIGY
jgi:hypothetical protein